MKPIAKHLPSVIEALGKILSTCSLINDARAEARGLQKYIMTFDAIVLYTIWVKVLHAIDQRNVIPPVRENFSGGGGSQYKFP